MIRAEAEARIRSRIGSISGVHVLDVKVKYDDQSEQLFYAINVSGWSTTLNEANMYWNGNVGVEHDGTADDIIDDLGERLSYQETLLQQGLRHATASPFKCGPKNTDKIECDHICGDKGLFELLDKQTASGRPSNPDGTVGEIQDALSSMRRQTHTGLESANETQFIDEIDMVSGIKKRWFEKTTYRCTMKLCGGATYDGVTLTWPHLMPDTIASAATGRRLGELIEGIPNLTKHRIASIRFNGEKTMINLHPEMVSMADYIVMRGTWR